MKKDKKQEAVNPRLGKVGGAAVLEGVMMRAGELSAVTCRREDGSLVVIEKKFTSVRERYKLLRLPIIRGIVGFIESLILSYAIATMAEIANGNMMEAKAEENGPVDEGLEEERAKKQQGN